MLAQHDDAPRQLDRAPTPGPARGLANPEAVAPSQGALPAAAAAHRTEPTAAPAASAGSHPQPHLPTRARAAPVADPGPVQSHRPGAAGTRPAPPRNHRPERPADHLHDRLHRMRRAVLLPTALAAERRGETRGAGTDAGRRDQTIGESATHQINVRRGGHRGRRRRGRRTRRVGPGQEEKEETVVATCQAGLELGGRGCRCGQRVSSDQEIFIHRDVRRARVGN